MTDKHSVALSDDDVLNYTQSIRKNIVDTLTVNGTTVPNDNTHTGIVLQALSDMDRVAISNKKMGAELGMSAADQAAAALIAKLSNSFVNGNPLSGGMSASGRIIEAEVTLLPEVEKVPGVVGIGIDETDYDNFVKRVEGTEDE